MDEKTLKERLAALSPEQRALLLKRLQGRGVTARDGGPRPEGPDLEADAELDASLVADTSSPRPLEPAEVFLTGATGFVGAFLLAELVESTSARIHCLVRAPDATTGRSRIRQNLSSYGLAEQAGSDRVVPVPGDLAAPQMGLSDEAFAALADAVDSVYHAAALLNFVHPYEAFKPANVRGTREVVRLACTGRASALHHISTTAFFILNDHGGKPHAIPEEASLELGRDCYGGYAQSKWVAERLVAAARDRGLPVNVYRLGLVTSHGETGAAHVGDIYTRMLRGFIEMQSAPTLDITLDVAPVDYIGKAVVGLSRSGELGRTFHLVRPGSPTLAQIIEGLRSFGYPIADRENEVWKRELRERVSRDRQHPLALLLPFFTEPHPPHDKTLFEMHEGRPRVDAMQTTHQVAQTSVTLPRADEAFGASIAWLVEKEYLPPGRPGHAAKHDGAARRRLVATDDDARRVSGEAMSFIESALERGLSRAEYEKIAGDIDVWQTSDAGRTAVVFLYRRLRLKAVGDPTFRALLDALLNREGYEGYLRGREEAES